MSSVVFFEFILIGLEMLMNEVMSDVRSFSCFRQAFLETNTPRVRIRSEPKGTDESL